MKSSANRQKHGALGTSSFQPFTGYLNGVDRAGNNQLTRAIIICWNNHIIEFLRNCFTDLFNFIVGKS